MNFRPKSFSGLFLGRRRRQLGLVPGSLVSFSTGALIKGIFSPSLSFHSAQIFPTARFSWQSVWLGKRRGSDCNRTPVLYIYPPSFFLFFIAPVRVVIFIRLLCRRRIFYWNFLSVPLLMLLLLGRCVNCWIGGIARLEISSDKSRARAHSRRLKYDGGRGREYRRETRYRPFSLLCPRKIMKSRVW